MLEAASPSLGPQMGLQLLRLGPHHDLQVLCHAATHRDVRCCSLSPAAAANTIVIKTIQRKYYRCAAGTHFTSFGIEVAQFGL